MIGVIADDLTGAAEIGAIGWRHGMRSEILGMAPHPFDADLVCINIDSRSLSPETAAGRAALAAETLQRVGARWIYKKVDSVLRGHVIAETRAVADRLSLHFALIVPANPRRGRVVREGHYYIREIPIHETEFGRDPEHPCHSSNVLDLLGCRDQDGVHVQGVGTELPPQGIVVGEAGSDTEMRAWAGRRSASILVGGAAEFFQALLEADAQVSPARVMKTVSDEATGHVLFVCGTRSESAGRFVEAAQRSGVPVFAWPDAKTDDGRAREMVQRVVDSLHSHPGAVLTSRFASAPESAGPGMMARALARLSCAVLRERAVWHVYVEGGATASCLLEELGWDRLRVVGEVAPGVATLAPPGARVPLLTLKPGSYEWPDAIQRQVLGGAGPAPLSQRWMGGRAT